jgi:hypothetical protein
LLPFDIPAQRPEIGRLDPNTAGHHQRHGFYRQQCVQENRARHRREGKSRKAGNESPKENGRAKK